MFVDRQSPSAFMNPMNEERSNTDQVTSAFLAELVGFLLDTVLDAGSIVSSYIA